MCVRLGLSVWYFSKLLCWPFRVPPCLHYVLFNSRSVINVSIDWAMENKVAHSTRVELMGDVTFASGLKWSVSWSCNGWFPLGLRIWRWVQPVSLTAEDMWWEIGTFWILTKVYLSGLFFIQLWSSFQKYDYSKITLISYAYVLTSWCFFLFLLLFFALKF